jgi:hypothetical protein
MRSSMDADAVAILATLYLIYIAAYLWGYRDGRRGRG